MRARAVRSAAVAALLTVASAAAAHAGPPWISIEIPANPHHASTRDALMVVRAYHHSTAIAFPVTARAEGLVDGKRVSVDLDVRPTPEPGVFAIRSRPDAAGAWVVVVTLTQGEDDTATALVALDGRGQVARVDVPSYRSRDGWTVPRAVTADDIEGALREAVRIASLEGGARRDWADASLPVGALLLVGLAAVVRRRR